MIRSFPFTIFPLIAYNLGAFLLAGALPDGWATPLFSIAMYSGIRWVLTAGDVMVIVGLFFLFIEMLRATIASSGVMANHMASVVILLVYAVEFATVSKAATSTFFILTAISLIDVLAGFSITTRAASRDVTYHPGY